MDNKVPERLKKMMAAVADTEKDNPSLWGMGVVSVVIVMHFLHSLAQKELSIMVMDSYSEATPAVVTLFLSLAQVVAALSVFRISGLSFSTSGSNREIAVIGVMAFSGGLYVNNYLMWSDDSAASACYRVQEPVICMLLLYLAARISTDTHRAGAVLCFCLGAAFLTSRFTLIADVRSLLYVIASIFVLSRNLIIKHLYDSNVSFSLRNQTTILYVAVGGTVSCILLALVISESLLVASLMAVVAGIVSTTLLYLVFTLLSLYDTLTAAVFVLWGHLLENVIFVVNGSRPSLISILLGAVLFAAGHYLYFKEGLESGTVHLNIKQVGVNELVTRLQFILYAASIVGLIASLLQPYISERDINVLSYVGLDRIARKLLSVRPNP